MDQSLAKKRNFYISYIKGAALVFIVFIHLIDWSNLPLGLGGRIIKEIFYTGILLFMLTTGSVIVIAYEHRTSLIQITKRLVYRGIQLLFFYYLYNIVKFLIFNFSAEPFYAEFPYMSTLSIHNILIFRSFSVPITILITYAFFLVLAPVFIAIHKKSQYPKIYSALLIIGIFMVNYTTALPTVHNPVVAFLYANGYVALPIMLWLVPFLMGFFLAQTGFEKQRKKILVASSVAMVVYGGFLVLQHKSLFPSDYQFPLSPYFMVSAFFILAVLMYVFRYSEQRNAPWVKKVLAVFRLLGDHTLHLYLYHWVVLDGTLWIFYPYTGFIWITVPLFFAVYLFIKRKKYEAYYAHQENMVRDMAAEVS